MFVLRATAFRKSAHILRATALVASARFVALATDSWTRVAHARALVPFGGPPRVLIVSPASLH
jgi:hypothetical protein